MTTQSSRGSRPDGRPRTVPCGNIAPANSLPQRSGQRQAPLAPVRPARSVGCSLPPKHHPAQVRGRRSPASLHTTSAAVPASMPPRAVDRAAEDGTGPPGTRLDPVVTAARRTEISPIATTRRTRDETAATGPTGGHQTAGRRTRWTPDGWTPDGLDTSRLDNRVRTREPDNRTLDGWTPDGWTPGPRTAGRVGRTPSSGHRPAVDSRQASWHPDHCDEDPTAGMLSRSSAGQTPRGPIRNQDSSAVEDPAGSWPPPRQTAVGDPPPSGRRLGALLSSDQMGGE